MVNIDLMPFTVFVLVTTFTPGPGNITSAAMEMLFGYKRTLRFLSGIVVGYLMIMVLCAFLSSTLLRIIPTIEPVLRLVGSCYILCLALGTARTNYNSSSNGNSPMLFKHGFLMQALNPKAIVFGLTIYTTFLSSFSSDPFILSVQSVFYLLSLFAQFLYGPSVVRG